MSSKIKVLIFTYIPSPYQVELFNGIAGENIVELNIVYLFAHVSTPTARLWKMPDLQHNHLILNQGVESYDTAKKWVDVADLVIFNYYNHPIVPQCIQKCLVNQKAWCFWGERPGYNQLGWLGKYYRRWKLGSVYHYRVPIWGIGKWAVEEYIQEFGKNRLYCNFPYFSDLTRFESHIQAIDNERHSTKFLFSGSLIHRKGVDLLATAFSRLAAEFPLVKLTFMGEGELRPQLQKKLDKYKNQVEFLGFQPWEKLPKFYHSADVLCVPSRYDGWALVVPEGMAAGLPVIGTNRTGAALELIKTDENGWLIPAGNAESLYQAMKKATLLSSQELSIRANAAQQTVYTHSLKYGIQRFHQAVTETLNYWQ